MSYTGLVERAKSRIELGRVCGHHTGTAHNIYQIAEELLDAIEALTRPVDGWQPIETAPKDGFDILLCDAATNTQVVAAWVDNGGWNWCSDGTRYHMEAFTHWMPLPDAPTLAAMETPHADG